MWISGSGKLAQVLDELLDGTALEYRAVGSGGHFLSSDHSFTISGFLEDTNTGERLINANIQDLHSGKGRLPMNTVSILTLLPVEQVSLFSYLGYSRRHGQLLLQEDKNGYIPQTLPDLRTGGSDRRAHGRIARAGCLRFQPWAECRADRTPAGGRGRYHPRSPSFARGSDGNRWGGRLHVRGGNSGQNLIMIDRGSVCNISHAAGIFSVFQYQCGSKSGTADQRRFSRPIRRAALRCSTFWHSAKATAKIRLRGTLVRTFILKRTPSSKTKAVLISYRWSFIDWYLQPPTRSPKAEKGGTCCRL